MNKSSKFLSVLSLLLTAGCTHETEEIVSPIDEFPVPQIVTRTETSLTEGSFIGLDANQEMTFNYGVVRQDTEGSPWEWSEDIKHPKQPEGKNELSQLAVVMPRLDIDTNARIYRITQEDLGNFFSISGLLWGVYDCPDGNPPTSFEANQQLAKLFIYSKESLLEYSSSFTLYLAPEATFDYATGLSIPVENEVEPHQFEWKSGQTSFSWPIFPQVFEEGTTLLEYELNGETRRVKVKNRIEIGPNQALNIELTKTGVSPRISITDWIYNEEVQDDATIYEELPQP